VALAPCAARGFSLLPHRLLVHLGRRACALAFQRLSAGMASACQSCAHAPFARERPMAMRPLHCPECQETLVVSRHLPRLLLIPEMTDWVTREGGAEAFGLGDDRPLPFFLAGRRQRRRGRQR